MMILERLTRCLGHVVGGDESKHGAEKNTDGAVAAMQKSPSSKDSSAKIVPLPATMTETTVMANLRAQPTDLDRYIYLRDVRGSNEHLFYKVLINNAEEILPYVYTPTVGEACVKYSHLPIKTEGIFITPEDKGKILEKLQTWPEKDIRVIVVTDGERILGLGDLGYNGMGISEGKILLYTVIAGVDPKQCLPVCIDVGTNNEEFLADKAYKGLKQPRLRGPEYDALLEEFVAAVRALRPHILLQFEDFGNTNAFRLLDKYRGQQCCFNDDIQGTACITLAGLFSALRVTGKAIQEQKILFLGAGEAGTGIGKLIASSMSSDGGLTDEQARQRCLYFDTRGLVCKSRTDLQHHKLAFAHDVPYQKDFLSALKQINPTMIVGVSTQAGAFTQEVVEYMAEINERPIIFPLSNPTSLAEVTYEDAFKWTKGKVVFASGSPFPPLKTPEGRTFFPAQANNAYVFGPIGMAALITRSKTITDSVFTEAATILARLTPAAHLEEGMLFPAFSDMKELAVPLIADIAQFMVKSGLGKVPADVTDWNSFVSGFIYKPSEEKAALNGLNVAPVPAAAGNRTLTTSHGSNVDEENELAALGALDKDIDRYIYLRNLQEQKPALFWKLLIRHANDTMSYVYTPTVGEACQTYCHLPLTTHGIFVNLADKGRILEKLQEWPEKDIRVVVVTDGERILGLGDLGYGGMGISEGKITLYTVIAGVDPKKCLPVCLDVGTNTEQYLQDPKYKGLRKNRIRGDEYDAFLDEFMTALRTWQPHLLLQFEDFGNTNAFRLLEKYRPLQCCFNDDIQGTACIALAGIFSALRVTGKALKDQKFVFLGAGEAGTGIGQLIAMAMVRWGEMSHEEALQTCYYLDSKGLVCKSRTDLQHHKLPFAHDVPFQADLLQAIRAIKPTTIIGVSTQAGAFSEEVLTLMAEINERPIVFPLSNPTSLAECTFADAYEHTGGRVVFASGSPFPSLLTPDGRTLYPAQANNAYVFPTIGMAAVLTHSKTIPDDVFLECAEKLGELTPKQTLEEGMLFPSFDNMKDVSPKLISHLAKFMVDSGLGQQPANVTDWEPYVVSQMYTL